MNSEEGFRNCLYDSIDGGGRGSCSAIRRHAYDIMIAQHVHRRVDDAYKAHMHKYNKQIERSLVYNFTKSNHPYINNIYHVMHPLPLAPAVDKRNLRYRIGPGSNPTNISKTERLRATDFLCLTPIVPPNLQKQRHRRLRCYSLVLGRLELSGIAKKTVLAVCATSRDSRRVTVG